MMMIVMMTKYSKRPPALSTHSSDACESSEQLLPVAYGEGRSRCSAVCFEAL